MESFIWKETGSCGWPAAGLNRRRRRDIRNSAGENAYWLEDYSLFMALKEAHGGKSWDHWEEPLRKREPEALLAFRRKNTRKIAYYWFEQYLFRRQWDRLHHYAAEQGIGIIGDIPIYVAFDSADTWANPELFQLDEELHPVAVAGCPPDAFSATGQLWGEPAV